VCTFVTSGQVASIVFSPRAAAFVCTTGATPCAEKTIVAPSGASSSLSMKIAPRSSSSRTTCALWTICLPDVDRRAVVLERELDRVDGPFDAGAVAAEGRQEHALDHELSVARDMKRPAASGGSVQPASSECSPRSQSQTAAVRIAQWRPS
jgi:hypothetical protein